MHKLFKTKYYFISKFDSNNIKKQDNKTVIVYRNYSIIPVNENLIIKIRDFCKKNRKKFYLSNNVKLAIKLDLDGAYIPSFNKKIYTKNYFLNNKFTLIGSAHNYKEITIKEKQGVSLIFLSPIFKTNKNTKYLGIIKFINLSKYTRKPVIALGGINNDNIKSLKLINLYGFAAIKYFKDNKTK